MAMNYFRRAVLAGNNLKRSNTSVVRGAIRRSNPDGFSVVPYFPNVAAGQTLLLTVQATPVTVTLTGPGLATVIADVNAAFQAAGVAGLASDMYGSLALTCTAQGANSYIAVTGGTAAEFLGFDLLTQAKVESRGGDIPSVAGGDTKDWNGTSFPRKGEDFTVDSINRTLGRLAGNSDVLYSEVFRNSILVDRINTSAVAGGVSSWAAPVDIRVFSGMGTLSRASTAAELVPFFFVSDRLTGQLAASRVVAVVKGTPGVVPPPAGGYANTASYGANDGGNILGLDLTKTSSPITKIRQGQVAECAVGAFVTAGVKPGDFAEISGATNLKPFNHNGYRWVVEEVLSNTALRLRAMSKAEASELGLSFDDVYPVIELNGEATGGDVYGTLAIKTGLATSGVTFVFNPPLPAGGQYDVWAAHAAEWSPLLGAHQGLRTVTPEVGTDADALLSGFASSVAGANVTVAEGWMRWKGRTVSVPSRVFTGFAVSSTTYIRVDPTTAALSTGALTASMLPVAEVTTDGTGAITLRPMARLEGVSASLSLTVGVGGEVATLDQAVAHVNAWARTFEAGQAYSNGAYPHVEVVLLSVQDAPLLAFQTPSVSLRGAVPGVELVCTNTKSLRFNGTRKVVVEGLTLSAAGDITPPLITLDGIGFTADVTLSNLASSQGHSFNGLVAGTSTLGWVRVENSYFRARGNLIGTASTNGSAVLSGCHVGGGLQLVLNRRVYVSDCYFDVPLNVNGTANVSNSEVSTLIPLSLTGTDFITLVGCRTGPVTTTFPVLTITGCYLDSVTMTSVNEIRVSDTFINANVSYRGGIWSNVRVIGDFTDAGTLAIPASTSVRIYDSHLLGALTTLPSDAEMRGCYVAGDLHAAYTITHHVLSGNSIDGAVFESQTPTKPAVASNGSFQFENNLVEGKFLLTAAGGSDTLITGNLFKDGCTFPPGLFDNNAVHGNSVAKGYTSGIGNGHRLSNNRFLGLFTNEFHLSSTNCLFNADYSLNNAAGVPVDVVFEGCVFSTNLNQYVKETGRFIAIGCRVTGAMLVGNGVRGARTGNGKSVDVYISSCYVGTDFSVQATKSITIGNCFIGQAHPLAGYSDQDIGIGAAFIDGDTTSTDITITGCVFHIGLMGRRGRYSVNGNNFNSPNLDNGVSGETALTFGFPQTSALFEASVQFSGNRSSGSLELTFCSNSSISGNSFFDVECPAADTQGPAAVYLGSCRQVVVTGNNIQTLDRTPGIEAYKAHTSTRNENISVTGNMVYVDKRTTVGASPIWLKGLTGGVVEGNICVADITKLVLLGDTSVGADASTFALLLGGNYLNAMNTFAAGVVLESSSSVAYMANNGSGAIDAPDQELVFAGLRIPRVVI